MQITALSSKALQMEGRIQGRSGGKPMAVLGSDSLVRLVELDKHVRVMIEVGEEETTNGLRRLIPVALRWRDWVLKIQGPWTSGGRGYFLARLDTMQREGASYRVLAKRLSRNLESLLREFLAWEQQRRAVHRQTKPPDVADDPFWPNPFAKVHAVGLLTDLGISEEEAKQRVEEGLRRVHDAQSPEPITRQRVIDALRRWRRRYAPPLPNAPARKTVRKPRARRLRTTALRPSGTRTKAPIRR